MKTILLNFVKRWGVTVLIAVGVTAFIVVAGRTGSCAACSAVTDLIGISK